MNDDLERELRALRPIGLDAQRRDRLEFAVRTSVPRPHRHLSLRRLAIACLVIATSGATVITAWYASALPVEGAVAVLGRVDDRACELGRLQAMASDPERLIDYLARLPHVPAPVRAQPTIATLIAELP